MVAPLVPGDIRWIVSTTATLALAPVRGALGASYQANRDALQRFLCNYFNAGDCLGKMGKTISPIESGVARAKGFKVRWVLPGSGKSGGLRIAVLAFCEERRVVMAGVWVRKEDPSDEEFAGAFSTAAQ